MTKQYLPFWGVLGVLIAVASLASVPLAGQTPTAGAKTAGATSTARNWTPPKTPWGDPDLQGTFTNLTYRGASAETFRLIERFTRTAPNIVEWTVTIDDPATWTRPWTLSLPLTMNEKEPVLEYACHEGNYAVSNILSGARADEKAAVAQGKRTRQQ